MNTKKIAVDLPDEAKEKIDKFFQEHGIKNNAQNRSKFISEALNIYMEHELLKCRRN